MSRLCFRATVRTDLKERVDDIISCGRNEQEIIDTLDAIVVVWEKQDGLLPGRSAV